MKSTGKRTGKFIPSIDIDIFDRLGINLYSKIESAISETIANAYDANATKCSVLYDSSKEGEETIAIVDDGKGLTENEFMTDFMKIGKKTKGIDLEHERFRMGAKGIGKLAPLFYAEYYDIYSFVKGELYGLRFSKNENYFYIKNGNSIFFELKKDDFEMEVNPLIKEYLGSLKSWTIIIPKALKKKLPFRTKIKKESFIKTMKNKFSMPSNVKFDISFFDLTSKTDISLRGDLLSPVLPDSTVAIYKTDVNKYFDSNATDYEIYDLLNFSPNSNYKISGYMSVQSSIRGLKLEELPQIKIYSHGRLVGSFLASEFSKNRAIGMTYIGGAIEMDDLILKNATDIISDNREGILFSKSDDKRIKFLTSTLANAIKDCVKTFQRISSAIRGSKDKVKEDKERKENADSFALVNEILSSAKGFPNYDEVMENLNKLATSKNYLNGKALIISHSSFEGGKYANFLINFLTFLGLLKDVEDIKILNTSSRAYGLSNNESFLDNLSSKLKGCNLYTFFILSPNFFNAWFTPFEAGAIFNRFDKQKVFSLFANESNGAKDPLSVLKPPFSQDKTMPFIDEVINSYKAHSEISDTSKSDITDGFNSSSNKSLHSKYFSEMISKFTSVVGMKLHSPIEVETQLDIFMTMDDIFSNATKDFSQTQKELIDLTQEELTDAE